MFERYTEKARHVLVLANDEARRLRHTWIGTEHLLLALLAQEGVAHDVLEGLGVELVPMRLKIERTIHKGAEPVVGQIPFTPRAKKVLEFSLREALSLGHNYIATEHLLLALARESGGIAARALLDLDIDEQKVRTEVIRALSGRDVRTPDRVRCDCSLSLYGAHFTCQLERDHDEDEHVEHGVGWVMRWTEEG